MFALFLALLAVPSMGETAPGATVAFYFVKGSEGRLDDAILEDTPFLTDEDILAYDWATHTMSITPEAVSHFPIGMRLPLTHKRFVVVAVGRRCFYGAFVNPLSSFGAGCPQITAMGYDPHAIRISGGPSHYTDADGVAHDEPDRRENADLRAALEALGKLTDGIPGTEEYARRCEIEFVIHRGQRIRVRVAKLGTQDLFLIEDRFFEAGKHVVTWDGTLAGAPAASGPYLILASGDDVDQMKRIEYVAPGGDTGR